MNDGTAFPFVMLGLGLLGHHDLGAFGWRWFAVDVAWAITAGIVIGGVLGTAMGRWVLHLRTTHREAVGLDDLLALGLIALSYCAALLVHGYGFLAVFAAGIALRRIERMRENVEAPPDVVQGALAAQTGQTATTLATDTTTAPGYIAEAALGFTVQHLCGATWGRGRFRSAAHSDHLHRYCRVSRGARCFGDTTDAAIQSFERGGAAEGRDAWVWQGSAFVPEVNNVASGRLLTHIFGRP